MDGEWRVMGLSELGVLRIHGPDAARFLQGQISNDAMRITPQLSLLAGYHNPQGRVIALLRLLQSAPEQILVVLPRELAASVASRLSRFILRAKVKLVDESAVWRVRGIVAPSADYPGGELSGLALLTAPDAQAGTPDGISIRIAGTTPRWLVISPDGASDPLAAYPQADAALWRRLDIEAGLPQVYANTSEAFVAQMLNLDLIGAISFEKGCYTGQEVIARAHYRGRVKRRMQRFRTTEPTTLARNDSGRLSDGRSFKLVDAVNLDDGRCEFLAVAPLAVGSDEEAADSSTQTLHAESLPLPYALPE